jgi:C_GCAxxG_C_C family probable redox protein
MTLPEVEKAVAFYKQGYTCTQSILGGFADRYGLPKDLAFRIGEPFGAGTSCTNGMCGSVTGAIMVLGLQSGSARNDDEAARYYTYQSVNERIQRFIGIHGSIQCGDLLGYDLSDPQQLQIVLEKGLFMQLCPNLVRDAAQILIEMIGTAIPRKSE